MRIISGERRGAKLLTPKGTNTRPTRGRVKEALFNILSGHQFINVIRQRVVIDAFAGSGALGLEALSRGAALSIFIENDHNAIKTLKHNIRKLDYQQRTRIIKADACTTDIPASEEAGLIIMDPPYELDLAHRCMETLKTGGWIGEETIMILEHCSSKELDHPPWLECFKMQKYGVTCLFFYRKKTDRN